MNNPKQLADLISDTLDTLPNEPTKESVLVARILLELIRRFHQEVPTEWMYFNGKFESTTEYLEYYSGLADKGNRSFESCVQGAQSYWQGVVRNVEEVLKQK